MSETTIHSSELGRDVDDYTLQTMRMALDPECWWISMEQLGGILKVSPSRALRATMEMVVERKIEASWAWYVAASAQIVRCDVSAMQMPLPAAPPISARPAPAPAPVAAPAPTPAPTQQGERTGVEDHPLVVEWVEIWERFRRETGLWAPSPVRLPKQPKMRIMRMLCEAWYRYRLSGRALPHQEKACQVLGMSDSVFGTIYSDMYGESPAGAISRRYTEQTAPQFLREIRDRVVDRDLSDEDWDRLVAWTASIRHTEHEYPMRAVANFLGIEEKVLSERRRAQGLCLQRKRRHE